MSEFPSGVAAQAATPDDLIQRALSLWSEPLDADVALDAFHAVYTDPITVNGRPTRLSELVARAQMLKAAIASIHHRIHATVITPDRVALAFTITGRHTGTLATPRGDVTATHREITVAGLDIFELDPASGRITTVWAVADWVALLPQPTPSPDHD